MQTITTYNGITLGLVELKDKDINHNQLFITNAGGNLYLKGITYFNLEREISKLGSTKDLGTKDEIIGATSTLTNEQVEPFVESEIDTANNNELYFANYKKSRNEDMFFEVANPLESFNSLLEANGVDLTKNYVILKLINNVDTN